MVTRKGRLDLSKLKSHQKMRISALADRGTWQEIDAYLGKLGGKGFDVAGVPFQLLDRHVCGVLAVDLSQFPDLATHTLGGQPRLFRAICASLASASDIPLEEIVNDSNAHDMTRCEAMGWLVFLAHRASFSVDGDPAADVFQFWDDSTPPREIARGQRLWRSVTAGLTTYDDAAARDYLAAHFGTGAVRGYDALWHPALKSDLFRLYRLVHDGGIYCDADSHPEFAPGKLPLFDPSDLWATAMTQVPFGVTINGFLACGAGHPVMAGFLDFVLARLRDHPDLGIFWLSGPGALTSYLYGCEDTSRVRIAGNAATRARLYRQFDAPYKQTSRNWRVFEHERGVGNEPGARLALSGLRG